MTGCAPPSAPCTAGRLALVGRCRIAGTLVDCGAYPALVDGPPGAVVHGELFRIVDPSVLAELDRYEGCGPDAARPWLFERLLARLVAPSVDAWVYRAGAVRARGPIPGGDWRAHRRARPL